MIEQMRDEIDDDFAVSNEKASKKWRFWPGIPFISPLALGATPRLKFSRKRKRHVEE